MTASFPIVVLISGRGSNLKSINEKAKFYQIVSVLSDKPSAPGLAHARTTNIPTEVFDAKSYSNKKELRAAIYEAIRKLQPRAIALAGFMQLIDTTFIEEYWGQLINIHPSLLPKFPGLTTHKRALEAKETSHGCTVHFVDSGVDTGPVIAQAVCACKPEDTEETLAARVLALEHDLYPWVLNHFALGHIKISGREVFFSQEMRDEASRLNFILPKG